MKKLILLLLTFYCSLLTVKAQATIGSYPAATYPLHHDDSIPWWQGWQGAHPYNPAYPHTKGAPADSVFNQMARLLGWNVSGSTDSSIFATHYYGGVNYYPLTGNPSNFLTGADQGITSSGNVAELGATTSSGTSVFSANRYLNIGGNNLTFYSHPTGAHPAVQNPFSLVMETTSTTNYVSEHITKTNGGNIITDVRIGTDALAITSAIPYNITYEDTGSFPNSVNLSFENGKIAIGYLGSPGNALVSCDSIGDLTKTIIGTGLSLIKTGFIDTVKVIGAGTNLPDVSAVFDCESTTQGFLPPQMTTTQILAIPTPKEGLLVYDLLLHQMAYWNGSAWVNF